MAEALGRQMDFSILSYFLRNTPVVETPHPLGRADQLLLVGGDAPGSGGAGGGTGFGVSPLPSAVHGHCPAELSLLSAPRRNLSEPVMTYKLHKELVLAASKSRGRAASPGTAGSPSTAGSPGTAGSPAQPHTACLATAPQEEEGPSLLGLRSRGGGGFSSLLSFAAAVLVPLTGLHALGGSGELGDVTSPAVNTSVPEGLFLSSVNTFILEPVGNGACCCHTNR